MLIPFVGASRVAILGAWDLVFEGLSVGASQRALPGKPLSSRCVVMSIISSAVQLEDSNYAAVLHMDKNLAPKKIEYLSVHAW